MSTIASDVIETVSTSLSANLWRIVANSQSYKNVKCSLKKILLGSTIANNEGIRKFLEKGCISVSQMVVKAYHFCRLMKWKNGDPTIQWPNFVVKKIRHTLEPYAPKTSEILSISEGDNVHFQNLILDIFPDAQLRKNPSTLLWAVTPSYPKSSVLVLYNPENINPFQLNLEFSGLLIIAIGKSATMDRLERGMEDYWGKILELSLDSFEKPQKIIILKNYFEIPKFQNIDDEIYHSLREYLKYESISIRVCRIFYFNLVSLARFMRNIRIRKILAINAGSGKIETAICKLLFPNAELILTDIDTSLQPSQVEELSAFEAIRQYPDCEMMITCWPNTESTGYDGILDFFHGKYIMYLGDDTCDPEYCFVEQLKKWGNKVFFSELCSLYFEDARIEIFENDNN